MIASVSLVGQVDDVLLKHTLRVYPKEACALLFGVHNGDSSVVTQAIPMRNAKRSDRYFAIRRYDYERISACNPLPCIGVYHAHHSSTQLSQYDRSQIREGSIWLIGTLAGDHTHPFLELSAYTCWASDIVELALWRNWL